jgi:hypothetical protein
MNYLILFLLACGFPLPESLARPALTELHIVDQRDYWDQATIFERVRNHHKLPPITDLAMLPPDTLCLENILFACHYRLWLNSRIQSETSMVQPYRDALREADILYSWWDAARDAHKDYYSVYCRRQMLAKCRDLLEPEDWAAMRWPPHVPLWRFTDETKQNTPAPASPANRDPCTDARTTPVSPPEPH